MPPEKANASAAVLLAATLLRLTVVLLIVADPLPVTKMPPPCGSPQLAELERSTVLSLTALSAIVSLPDELMPPPLALHPFGKCRLAASPLTESNRRPSPYHFLLRLAVIAGQAIDQARHEPTQAPASTRQALASAVCHSICHSK